MSAKADGGMSKDCINGGSHTELLAADGIYASMARAQSLCEQQRVAIDEQSTSSKLNDVDHIKSDCASSCGSSHQMKSSRVFNKFFCSGKDTHADSIDNSSTLSKERASSSILRLYYEHGDNKVSRAQSRIASQVTTERSRARFCSP